MIDLPEFTLSPPALAGNAVHLWLLDTGKLTQADIARYYTLLSDDERIREQSFKQRATQYVAARILLRKVLSHYTGVAPHALAFEKNVTGKPGLPGSNIHFNLSHSAGFALLAIGSQTALGVDIEGGRRSHKLLEIATRYFHPTEIKTLQGLGEADIRDYFFRLWTLKEAFFKALGTGIATGLDKASFTLATKISVRFAPELQQQESRWQFHQTCLPPNYHCALAVNSEKPIVITWLSANDLFFTEAFA